MGAKTVQPYIVRVTTSGEAGTSTGTGTVKGVAGVFARLAINWHASAAATSDLTITESWDGGSRILYASTDSVTDVDTAPLYGASDIDASGAASAASTGMPLMLIGGTITVSVAQGDALTDCVIVTLGVLE